MLDALISLRQQGETELKKRGDVLTVKLAGSPWGEQERRTHQVIELKDDDLEAQLLEAKEKGEPHPVIVHPYSVYEDQPITNPETGEAVPDPQTNKPMTQRVMVSRSTKYLDVDALGADIREDVLDSTKQVDRLPAKKAKLKTR